MDLLKSLHYFRRVPRDISEGTTTGGLISMCGALLILYLMAQEIRSHFTTRTTSRVIMDSNMDGLLLLFFNITMHHVPCKYASVDVEDRHGNMQVNITGDIVKYDISQDRRTLHHWVPPSEEIDDDYEHPGDHSMQLNGDTFKDHLAGSPFTAVTFFSIKPDCELSQMWVPGWETVAMLIKGQSLPGEIHVASVNCSEPVSKQLCKDNGILGTPAIRVYHGDSVMKNGYVPDGSHRISQMPKIQTNKQSMKDLNREYHGHRMVDLVADWIIAERKVASNDPELDKVATSFGSRLPGCEISGFLKVTRAPGNFHLSCHSMEHTFDVTQVNTTHSINSLFFGGTEHVIDDEELHMLAAQAIENNADTSMILANPLAERTLTSTENVTIHHYLKIVTTRFEKLIKHSGSLGSLKEYLTVANETSRIYQYAATHTKYKQSDYMLPSAKFSWDLAPLQIVLSYEPASNYRFGTFLTSLCAIVGGVYVVLGIIDASVHHTILAAISSKKTIGH